MEMKLMAILLVTQMALAITGHGVPGKDFHFRHKSLKVERNTDNSQSSNKVVKSIQSEDGDIIDCFDIYKQPAFDHPALKDHKIQMKPSYVPTEDISSKTWHSTHKQKKGNIPIAVPTQRWQKSGICPNGTVPIRRIQKKSAYEPRKPPGFFRNNSSKHFNDSIGQIKLLRSNHSISILLTVGYAYLGAQGDIAVFNPYVELESEYTTSQVRLLSGPRDDFEAVEAGTAVNPMVYHDINTRIFVHWTVDGSRNTGCFDHFCPGFVQVNQEIALGASLTDQLSDPFALIYIYKDVLTNNWWVSYGNKSLGYWPGELFNLLKYHADMVQWGGDVYSSRVGGTHPHTETGMGSGHLAFPGRRDSGSVRRIRVLENSLVLKFPEWTNPYSDEYNCYNYILYRDVPDPEFYYGGPGRSLECP